MGRIKDRVVKMESQLENWAERLDELVADAQQAGADAKEGREARIEELQTRIERARADLREAQAAGADKWEAFSEGLENAWGEVESAFKSLND